VIFFAVLLGSLLGLYLAFLAVIMDRRIIGFNSEFVPSWPAIIAAALICAGVSILAAIKPASGAAFARPGTLIAAGRG